jgi:hypothetical protein
MAQCAISKIPLTFVLNNIDSTEFTFPSDSTLIVYNSKNYLISDHQGLPIKYVKINDIIIKDYIICNWCDLIIIPFENISTFAPFKHFVKKQINSTDNLFLEDTKLTYVNTIMIPINNLPHNPSIMYNILSFTQKIKVSPGMPIYTDNFKLCGIVSKITDTSVLCIPMIYILRAFEKIDNTTIYKLKYNDNSDNITKINNYKILCNKVYCQLHKNYIPITTFIVIYGDTNQTFNIVVNDVEQICGVENFDNIDNIDNISISNTNNIIQNNNRIKVTSGLLHLLKIYKEYNIIDRIFKMKKGTDLPVFINEKNIILYM